MSYELRDKDGPFRRKMRAKGSYENGKSKSPRVTISFEPHLFVLLSNRAQKRGISFASLVRELIDDGLCVENWDPKELDGSPESWMAAYGVGQRRAEKRGV